MADPPTPLDQEQQPATNRALELRGFTLPEFGGNLKNASRFLAEVQAEFKKISWPTRRQVIAETGVVIFVCAFLTGLVLFYDWIFTGVANRVFYGQ